MGQRHEQSDERRTRARERPRSGRSRSAAGRRTQAQRSAATRALLLEATIECLADLGYAHTTTGAVARRAGLSRGAQLHHYPTKQELVAHAIEHLFAQRRAAFLDAFEALPPEVDRLEGAIDLLWAQLSGPSFAAVLELIVAARSERVLRERILPLLERFRATVDEIFLTLFGDTMERGPIFDVAAPFALALLEGLALDRVLGSERDSSARVIETLKHLSRLLLPSRASRSRSLS